MARGARGGRGDGRWRDCSAEEMAREREGQKEIVRREARGRVETRRRHRREREAKAKHQQCSERRRAAPRLFVRAVIFFLGQASVFVTILELLRLEDPRMVFTSSEPLRAMRTLLFTTLKYNI